MSGSGYAGMRLGRYEVVKHLASGGMAQVLLARARGIEGFERFVVIKQIHVERAKDEQVVRMFLDEARMSASLHHNNIVQVHDIGQEKGEYFFAMEYVHGEDVRKLLNFVNRKQEQVPLEHVLTIVIAAAAGLHYAHEHTTPDRTPLNIVHRDVSPANILVSYDGTVKVVDFGIAKAAFRSTETQSGTLKGKISYMSPEQCMGRPVDRRSDVFALGIVLYELATVRRLFKGSSDFLTMSAIVQGTIPSAITHRPDLPPELDEIISKALQLRPEDRFQSADELRVALARFAKKVGLRGSPSDLSDYMREVFGQRPEPWLVDDEAAKLEVADVDFDGSASGAAPIPDPTATGRSTGIPTPPPGSLMARVRRKVAPPGGVDITTPRPPTSTDRSTIPPATAPASDAGWTADGKSHTTASGTPMAYQVAPSVIAAAPRRRWIAIAGGAVVALAVGLGVIWFTAKGSTSERSGPPTASQPAREPVAPGLAPAVPRVVEPAASVDPQSTIANDAKPDGPAQQKPEPKHALVPASDPQVLRAAKTPPAKPDGRAVLPPKVTSNAKVTSSAKVTSNAVLPPKATSNSLLPPKTKSDSLLPPKSDSSSLLPPK